MTQADKWSLPTEVPKLLKGIKRVKREPYQPKQSSQSKIIYAQKPKEESPKGFSATLKGIFGLGKL